MRGAAESLQLQKHFCPGGVGDATHSRPAGEGAQVCGGHDRGEVGGAAARRAAHTPANLFPRLNGVRRSPVGIFSNLVSERVFDDDGEDDDGDEPLSLSFSLSD